MNISNKKGMTLNEIMLAVVILAVSFIPIMGVLTSSFKTTEKDDHTIKGMQLCQEKLALVLQFPYDYFNDGTYEKSIDSPANADGLSLHLVLGDENFRIHYHSSLKVETKNVTFTNVPVFDFTEMIPNANSTATYPYDFSVLPNANAVNRINKTVSGKVKEYTITVKWHETGHQNIGGAPEGSSDPTERFYTLSVLKADTRKKS